MIGLQRRHLQLVLPPKASIHVSERVQVLNGLLTYALTDLSVEHSFGLLSCLPCSIHQSYITETYAGSVRTIVYDFACYGYGKRKEGHDVGDVDFHTLESWSSLGVA